MPKNLDKPTDEEEIRRIGEFMQRLQTLLEAVVVHPENIIPGRHHDAMRDAWDELRPQFAMIKLTPSNRPQLEKVGLVGYRLAFELAVFSHARDELLDHAPELFSRTAPPSMALPILAKLQPPQKDAAWWTRLRRLFRRCLKAGDVVLGSLGKIPVFGMPAEAIKEFKEIVEEGVALSDALA